jgi:formate dehydrogenase iron-sulfur subunit
MKLTRRAFFTSTAAGCALGAYATNRAVAADTSKEVGVLVDLTRCIGCRACENACRLRWGEEGLPKARVGFGKGDGKLTFKTRTFVDRPTVTHGGTERTIPVKKQCMHCRYPACVSVCPVGALEKTETGPVIYKESICIGCRYCILACPYNAPKYEWDNALMPRVGKCNLCAERIAEGLAPACVTVCPTGTLKFGKRDALLQEARARMNAQPNRYKTLYGDKVVGGTSWLYLSDVPADQIGFRTDLPDAPLPALTWKAISKVPFVIIGVGLLLSTVFRFRRKYAEGIHG